MTSRSTSLSTSSSPHELSTAVVVRSWFCRVTWSCRWTWRLSSRALCAKSSPSLSGSYRRQQHKRPLHVVNGNAKRKTTGAARHGQGGHLPPPLGNVQMGICNPSPEFLTVFVVGLSRISGVVPTYLRVKLLFKPFHEWILEHRGV